MDQLKIIDDLQEEILNRLPDEAIAKLAQLDDDNNVTDEAVNAILAEYGVNPNKIVSEMARKDDNGKAK